MACLGATLTAKYWRRLSWDQLMSHAAVYTKASKAGLCLER